MDSSKKKPASVDEYITGFPDGVQNHLQTMRETIQAAVPDAQEAIKYDMPTFVHKVNLISFAAWKSHIAFYPKPYPVDEALEKEIATYKGTKGSVHFPLDKPLPVELIGRMVKARLEQVLRDNP